MFYFLSVVAGVFIAVMIMMNGALTAQYGVYTATVLIHAIGLLFVALLVGSRRERFLPDVRLPFYLYLGGVIGTATTVFNNLAFAHISVSALLALGLLGQSIAAIAIDQFGLFGMQRRRFAKKKLAGLACIVGGIVVMLVL